MLPYLSIPGLCHYSELDAWRAQQDQHATLLLQQIGELPARLGTWYRLLRDAPPRFSTPQNDNLKMTT